MYLFFCYLHVEYHIIHQLWHGLLQAVPELAGLDQTVDELEHAEDEVLEAQHLAVRVHRIVRLVRVIHYCSNITGGQVKEKKHISWS